MTQNRMPYLITAAIVAISAAYLYYIGRAPICTCGYVKLWHGHIRSSENSQHLADWYTPSHFLHGLIFYSALWLVARRISFGWRLTIATLIESLWEIVENSDAVINRYREAGAIGYFGDSVVNSVADIGIMIVGFFVAARVPVWVSIALFVFFEALTLWLIRDGLTLNVIMLTYPLEVIGGWQSELWSTFEAAD